MKKFLVMFAIAGTLVACNNATETTETKEDSVVVTTPVEPAPTTDTVVAPVVTDTTVVVDTTKK